jgi:hypothetical protein
MLVRDMQLGTSLHTWRQRLLALACALLSAACGHFDEIAGELAHAQGAGSSIVRRNAGMAYRMCREEAAYAYFEMVLGISRQGSVANPAAFGAWYRSEPAAQTAAGESQSWEQYCDELGKTGEIYDGAALSLREYARALGQLARGEDFDGSGLAKLGGSVSSIANAFAPKTSIGSAAKTTGGVVKKLTEVVVKLVRTRKLKKLVLRAAPQVTALSAALRDYLDGLEAERKLLQHHRETVLKVSDKRRDAAGGFTPAALGALVFDLSSDAELRLARYERELTRDRALLLEIAQAHAAVAAAALNKARERQARRDAARLLQSVQTWEDDRSKEH